MMSHRSLAAALVVAMAALGGADPTPADESAQPAPAPQEAGASGSQAEASTEAAATPGEAAPAAEPEPKADDPLAYADAAVAHATFASEIVDREPVDSITFLSNEQSQIFFFTDLRNLQGQTVSHRWEYGGVIVSTVPFEVGGPRWRVWSSKDLSQDALGEWKVSVTDREGVVLETRTFTYSDSGKPAELTP